MQTPTSIKVTIERILPGGLGLAHAEGLTLFVALAAPGDVVRVRIDRIRGKVAFASIEEIVKPSPVRVEPPCPYFGACGGCDFQQMTYEAQLKSKAEMIREGVMIRRFLEGVFFLGDNWDDCHQERHSRSEDQAVWTINSDGNKSLAKSWVLP